MKHIASLDVALIGDLVASRSAPSRAEAQQALIAALERVSHLVEFDQQLEPTIGDEFQSVHGRLDQALKASVLVRLALPEAMDARFGLGVGDLHVVGASKYGLTQDGPAWWSARDAIDEVKVRQRGFPGLRTWVAASERVDEAGRKAIDMANAYLLCRDELVSALDGRQRRIALALAEGRTHAEIARMEGISASAVSQRIRRSGIASLIASAELIAR